MCNACGNLCCGSDQFSGCGCDGCEEPECWLDNSDRDDDDMDEYGEPMHGFICLPCKRT